MRNSARVYLLVSLLSTNAKPLEIESNFLFGTLVAAPLLLGCASTYYFEKRIRSIRNKRVELVSKELLRVCDSDLLKMKQQLKFLTQGEKQARIAQVSSWLFMLLGCYFIATIRSSPGQQEVDEVEPTVPSFKFVQRRAGELVEIPLLDLKELEDHIKDTNFSCKLKDTGSRSRLSRSLSEGQDIRKSMNSSYSSYSSEGNGASGFTSREKRAFKKAVANRLVGKINLEPKFPQAISEAMVRKIIRPYVLSIMQEVDLENVRTALSAALGKELGVKSRSAKKVLTELIGSALSKQLESLASSVEKQRKRASNDAGQEEGRRDAITKILERDEKKIKILQVHPPHLQALTKYLEDLRRHLVRISLIEHYKETDKAELIEKEEDGITLIQERLISRGYLSTVSSFERVRDFYAKQLSEPIAECLQTLSDLEFVDSDEFFWERSSEPSGGEGHQD